MLKFIIIFFIFFTNSLADSNYFLTLRNDKVNLRLGPSFDYPVKIIYKKKYFPVLITDSSDNFRKVQDFEKNSGWVHISQLSKKRAGLTLKDSILFNNNRYKYFHIKLLYVIFCANHLFPLKYYYGEYL